MSIIKSQFHASFSYETQEEVLDIPHRSKPLLIGIPKEIEIGRASCRERVSSPV